MSENNKQEVGGFSRNKRFSAEKNSKSRGCVEGRGEVFIGKRKVDNSTPVKNLLERRMYTPSDIWEGIKKITKNRSMIHRKEVAHG